MTDGDAGRVELLRLLEELGGMPVAEADLGELDEVLPELGLTTRDELVPLLRQAREMIANAPPDPEQDASLAADALYGAALDRFGPAALDPEALAAQPRAIRMLLTTASVDGLVGNGGWVAMFLEGQGEIVGLSVDGYRLLGLESHAHLAERAYAHGYDPDEVDDPFWDELDGAWFALPEAMASRAAYIAAHPDEFATLR